MVWDGKERRKDGGMSSEDHDLLREIAGDTKYLRKSFDAHVVSDSKQFEKQDKQINVLQRWMWVLIGGGLMLQLVIHFVK